MDFSIGEFLGGFYEEVALQVAVKRVSVVIWFFIEKLYKICKMYILIKK